MTVSEEEFVSPNLFWQWNLYHCSKKLLAAIFLLSLFVPAVSHCKADDAQAYAELKNEKYPHLARMIKGSTIRGILGESELSKECGEQKESGRFLLEMVFS